MFGFFKKRPDPKTEAAYKKGQELGAQMSEAVDNWFSNGLKPYREFMLGKLRESLVGYASPLEIPPGYFVRSKLADFYEAVTETSPKVQTKTFEALNEWLEVSDVMDMRRDFEQLLMKRLGDFDASLRVEALEVMTDAVPRLVEAEKHWRTANPELSLRYPSADDPNFKGDGRNVMPF